VLEKIFYILFYPNLGFFEEHPDRKTFLIPGENISAG
jgi:hypothetical protein